MYGTLDNKNDSASLNSTNSPGSNDTQEDRDSLLNNGSEQESRRRKRIYSHCHVQSEQGNGRFSNNGQDKKGVDKSARRRLIAASIICLVFMIAEVVGGVLSNSLAIATDAAHLLTDFASFMISLFAIWLSSRPASKKMSFGWYRAEVIGALVSVIMIWLVTGLLVYMAVERLRTKQFEIDSLVMVITASAGLLVNIIMALALNVDGHSHGFHSHGNGHGHGHSHSHSHQDHLDDHHDDETQTVADRPAEKNGDSYIIAVRDDFRNGSTASAHSHCSDAHDTGAGRGRKNINVRAALIHVIGDFIQSLGVLIAALVIHFKPEYAIVDPICTFLFSIIVLLTTIRIIRDATNVLMEGIPDGINFIEVREKLQSLPFVIRVHNLRIWSLSLDKIAISSHLVIDSNKIPPSQALKRAIDTLKNSYDFFEVTIQIEEYKDDMKDCEHCQDEDVTIVADGK